MLVIISSILLELLSPKMSADDTAREKYDALFYQDKNRLCKASEEIDRLLCDLSSQIMHQKKQIISVLEQLHWDLKTTEVDSRVREYFYNITGNLDYLDKKNEKTQKRNRKFRRSFWHN